MLKRYRKSISLEEKIRILDRLKAGEKQSTIAKSLGLNGTTVRTIKNNEQKIRANVAAGLSKNANRVAKTRDINLVHTEKQLMNWIENCEKRNVQLDGKMIRVKAIQIYSKQKGCDDSSPITFLASRGWFEKFKRRNAIKNIQELNCETNGKCDETKIDKLVPKLSATDVRKGLQIADELERHFLKYDPSECRSRMFKRELGYALAPYYDLLREIGISADDDDDDDDDDDEEEDEEDDEDERNENLEEMGIENDPLLIEQKIKVEYNSSEEE